MSTAVQIPLNVRIISQDLDTSEEKPKWRVAPVIAQRGKAGHRDLDFYVVDLTNTRRVILSSEKGTSFGMENSSRLHTLRVKQTVRKGRKWEADGADRFIAPSGSALITLDHEHNVIVEEMPS